MPDVDPHVIAHAAKLHGLGNDYLVVDPGDLPVPLNPRVITRLCDRHRGIGSDGVLLHGGQAGKNSFRLRIFNPDGSEAEKSGNGIRIFARWLLETGRTTETRFTVITHGGAVPVSIENPSGDVTADMGIPVFREDLPCLDVAGEKLSVVALSVGNPHCVVFRPALDVPEMRRLGPLIEKDEHFPQRTNVQFAQVNGPHAVDALIWERGAGETMASGSSACAVAAACVRRGLVEREVTVSMPGGTLLIRIDDRGSIWMRGPVESVGTIALSSEFQSQLRGLA